MAEDLDPVILTFGGGINRRKRPFDINPQECYDGQNFDLDHQSSALKRRNAFQLIATAPNAQAIFGFAQHRDTSGNVSTIIQAGGDIYSWDGSTSFTAVGTCTPGSRLRGGRDSDFPLDDYVIITDLEKLTVVKQWDGTTFADFPHNLSQALFAKYCKIHGERAYFANVKSGTDTPHVLLASALSEPTTLTVSDRPSSSLSAADPFFIPSPDLKPINGLEKGFGVFLLSTAKGQTHVLAGTDATDFTLDSFYPGSAAAGAEAILNIGNDIILGLPGRIESLSGVDRFGDVETNDISDLIQPLIMDATEWRLAYDQTLQKVYCFPNSQSACWVLHKSVLSLGQFSPWSKWVTSHSMGFTPTCIMQIIDPSSGLESVFLGDSSGQIFKMEGQSATDGGTASISMFRRSVIFRIPDGEVFDITGSIVYLKSVAATVTLTFEYSGEAVFDQDIEISIPAATGGAFYNGDAYYGGNFYYNIGFTGKLNRQNFTAAGRAEFVQCKVSVDSDTDIEIQEITLNFRAKKK